MERRRGWELLGATTAIFFVTMVARLAPSPLVPDVMATFDVTKSQVGLALSGMWAAYALFQFPGGVVADRIGQRRVILFAVTAAGTGSLLLAAAPTFPAFAVFAFALGAGAGLYFTAGTAFLTGQFENTGRALGVHEIGASGGGLVGPPVAAFVATRFGWRAGLLVATLLAILAGVMFVRVAPRTPPVNPDQRLADQLAFGRLVALLSRPSIVLTTGVAMAAFFTWQSFASFFPTFLVEFAGVSTTRASLVFGAVFAVTLVGSPTLGRLSDTMGRDGMLAASFSLGAVGFTIFLRGTGLAALVAGTLLVGVGLSWPGVLNSRFMDHLAEDERGTRFGLVRTIVLLVSSLGSVVTGTLADVAGWLPAYGFVAGLLSLLVALLVLNRVLGLDA